jgi:hypothetical protein
MTQRRPLHLMATTEQGTEKAPWPVAGRAPNSAYDAPNFDLIRFFLRDLGDGRILFYSLAAAKTVEGRPTIRRRLGCSTTAAWVAPSSAPALRTASAVATGAGARPPSDGLAREAST